MKYGLVLLLSFIVKLSFSQCAMCRATLENQAESGGIGSSINNGILYLMPIPYVLIAIIGGVFYYRYRKMKALKSG